MKNQLHPSSSSPLVFSLLFQYFMMKMKVPLVFVSVLKGKCGIFFYDQDERMCNKSIFKKDIYRIL